jgi:hypothetical protein
VLGTLDDVRMDLDGMLIVGRDATVRGRIHVSELHCEGVLEGEIVVTGRAHLLADAAVAGSLQTATLQMAPGARFQGGLRVQGLAGGAAALPVVERVEAAQAAVVEAGPQAAEGLDGREADMDEEDRDALEADTQTREWPLQTRAANDNMDEGDTAADPSAGDPANEAGGGAGEAQEEP